MRTTWVLLLCTTLSAGIVGCSDGKDDTTDAAGDDDDDDDTTGDDDDDTTAGDDDDDTPGDDDDDVTGDTGTPPVVALTVPEVLYGLANADNQMDWRNRDPNDNDLFELVVTPSALAAEEITVTVSGTENVRIYLDGALLIDDDDHNPVTLPWPAADLPLMVEFGEFDVEGTLTLEALDATGAVVATAETRLRSAPLLLNHHLQPAETVVTMELDFGYADNDNFVAAYQAALGNNLETELGRDYRFDPWIQDEVEFATSYTPDGQEMRAVIDSIRDRGLDDYPEDRWMGEDFGVLRFSQFRYPNSLDSFGNLEVTPPVDGYPFGRIYYGAVPSYAPADSQLFNYLEDLAIQAPIQLDTTWLCVGHVDEFLTFIPDPTAPRGFRLFYTDTDAAWDVLEAMDPATQIPRYAGRNNHGYSTIGALLADQGLRDENDDLQDLVLDPILDDLTNELGLLPEEIVPFPGLFERVPFCYGTVAALIPGMVNLVVSDFDGRTQLFMADPFLRTDLGDQSTDPMIAAVNDLLPASIDPYYLDDWDIYHLGLGEVHCGSNVVRTPSFEDWWTNDLGGSQ